MFDTTKSITPFDESPSSNDTITFINKNDSFNISDSINNAKINTFNFDDEKLSKIEVSIENDNAEFDKTVYTEIIEKLDKSRLAISNSIQDLSDRYIVIYEHWYGDDKEYFNAQYSLLLESARREEKKLNDLTYLIKNYIEDYSRLINDKKIETE